MDEFAKDSLAIAKAKFDQGKIDRRQFMTVAAILGFSGPAVLGSRQAAAATTEVVLSNWGGDAVAAYKKAYGEPFEKVSGLKMPVDTTGPSAGKIKAMVESKKVTWDVGDSNLGVGVELGGAGLLEAIDYSIVDKNKVLPGLWNDHAIAGYGFSHIFVYDDAKFPNKKPQSWADFWNLKDFPGKRAMRRDPQGVVEAALFADGVPKDKIYPIDLPRAFKKIQEIKKDTIFWNNAAESQQLIRDGEVTMCETWNTRAYLLGQDTKGRVKTVLNQGMFQPNAWVVPKGNPAGREAAMKLIASMQDPGQQIEILKIIGCGPVNPAAAALVPAELKGQNPSDPAALASQVMFDVQWYAANQAKAQQAFLDFLAS